MILRTLLVAATMAASLALSSCGGNDTDATGNSDLSDSPNSDGSAPDTGDDGSASEVNPVDVLHKIDECVTDPGVSVGEPDMNGFRYASCTLTVSTDEYGDYDVDVTVRAADPTDPLLDPENLTPDDSHKVVFGDGFYLVATADPSIFGAGAVDMDAIAVAVGGHVVR